MCAGRWSVLLVRLAGKALPRGVHSPAYAPWRGRVQTTLPLAIASRHSSRRGLSGLLGRPRESSKPGTDAGQLKLLILAEISGWVPNGPSEQPKRKPGVRERFRAPSVSPRCTAARQKRPNSWVFRGQLSGGETVRIGNVGGGRGTVVQPSLCAISKAYNNICSCGYL